MHEADRVRGLERAQHPVEHRDRFGDAQWTESPDVFGQARPWGTLERDPRDGLGGSGVDAHVQHARDVRMPQRLGSSSLREERLTGLGPPREVRMQQLQCH